MLQSQDQYCFGWYAKVLECNAWLNSSVTQAFQVELSRYKMRFLDAFAYTYASCFPRGSKA